MSLSAKEPPSALHPIMRIHARRALTQSWNAFHPVPALYCAPGVVLALLIGLALGEPAVALLLGAGAFSVGFGAFQRLTRFHPAPMLLAALCMSLSTAVGTIVGGDLYLEAAMVAAAAFSLGLAASFGTGPWWVLLQGAIFLLISGANPGDLQTGVSRALAVLAGGAGQSLLVVLLRRLIPAGFPPLSSPNAVPPPETLAAWASQARQVLSPRSQEFAYAVVLALATGAAVLVARRLHMPNGYWAALTALLVFRRGGAETLTRGAQRIGGTVLGAAAATLLAALLRPDHGLLLALIGTAAWCAYATQWVNYGTFSLSVTSYVAFLLALLGLPEAEVAAHRVAATLLGAAIALAALALSRLVPPRPSPA
jgi:uncharacterized membrane protein YgaE (UPF0421/DUF939 family)